MRFFIALMIVFVSLELATAQFFGAISIDRPGFGSTFTTVKKNHFQIESGIYFERDTKFPNEPNLERKKLQFANTLFRYGFTKSFEVRLGSQFTYQQDKTLNSKSDIATVEGVSIGAKLRAFENRELFPMPQ
ncbi:MAG: hypothetical protein GXO77_08475 [Calditrichaeota bacterium]|nr:hypothetical protein [Calditrichota bacterium]